MSDQPEFPRSSEPFPGSAAPAPASGGEGQAEGNGPGGETGGAEVNSLLQEALERTRPRFFRVSEGAARGRTGRADTARFADDLVTLQECAQIIGERLGMQAVAFGAIYDGENTAAFRYDPDADPANPQLTGALVNRRMPMRDLLGALRDHHAE